MTDQNKDELLDYLFEYLETFEVNDDEKKVLVEYIENIVASLNPVYDFIDRDGNKLKFVEALESLIEEGNG